MSTEEKLAEEEITTFETLLPMCEANRQLVVNPLSYAGNLVFRVGALRLIDKAP